VGQPNNRQGVRRTGDVEAVPFHQMGFSEAELQNDYGHWYDIKDKAIHVDHLVCWFQKACDGVSVYGDILGVSLHRYDKRERLFAGHETEVAKLLFTELHWLHSTGRLTTLVPDVSTLSPRLKQVLTALLAGESPKQIARQLELSVLTVRDHIKRLYRELNINGRDELMTKFTQRSPIKDVSSGQ
jgi:DNA-binding CsgD family transcriptional regulator